VASLCGRPAGYHCPSVRSITSCAVDYSRHSIMLPAASCVCVCVFIGMVLCCADLAAGTRGLMACCVGDHRSWHVAWQSDGRTGPVSWVLCLYVGREVERWLVPSTTTYRIQYMVRLFTYAYNIVFHTWQHSPLCAS
jgi:hypothetical protein